MQKRKRSIWEWLCLCGVPHAVLLFFIGIIFCELYFGEAEEMSMTVIKTAVEKAFSPTAEGTARIKKILIATLIAWGVVVLKNLVWVGTSKKIGFLTFLDKYTPEADEVSSRKLKAQNPLIPEEYLSSEPESLTLGKRGKYFVRYKMCRGDVLHTMILGSSGTGKSTLLCSTLIYEFNLKQKLYEQGKAQEPMTVYCTDIKPELAAKSVVIAGNPRVHVMNPDDRSTYGWDPYYRLTPESSDDDIVSEVDVISRALIYEGEDGKESKNSFFYNQARTIFKAILFFTYKEGRSFMQGIRYLTDGKLSEVISKTLDVVDGKVEYDIVRRLLVSFTDKEDSDAYKDIEMTLR